MRRRTRYIRLLAPLVALSALVLYASWPVRAEIQRLYPLAEVLQTSDAVARARVAARDPQQLRLALEVDGCLKGKLPFTWIDVDLRPGGWVDPGAFIARTAPGLPILLFVTRVRERYVVLLCTEGSWFQFSAPDDAKDKNRLNWAFTRGDPNLRRTYAGKTADLDQLIQDVLAGRKQAPAPDPHAAGLGPVVPTDYKPDRPAPVLPAFLAARYSGAPQPVKPASPAAPADPNVAFAALPAAERPGAAQLVREFNQPPAIILALYQQAQGDGRDVRNALVLARQFGNGGARAWVRTPAELLALKQHDDRLTWLDVRECLDRASEMFRPVEDPVTVISRLRQRYTWDELDPLFEDDKYNNKSMDVVFARWAKERMAMPLLPTERLLSPAYVADFGLLGDGEIQMERYGWAAVPGMSANLARRQYAWNGRDTDAPQAPGTSIVRAPDSVKSEMPNAPPQPGLPLADNQGRYAGTALWFADGVGDHQGQRAGPDGAYACYNAGWIVTPQGQSQSFLIDMQIYVPDHSDEVGEPRSGAFVGKRKTSRYVAVGVRLADAQTRSTGISPATLSVNVEPAPDRFERVLLRVDVKPTSVSLIAFIAGLGEVGRATANVNSTTGIALAPLLGIGRPGAGFVPEFYLARLSVAPIDENDILIARGQSANQANPLASLAPSLEEQVGRLPLPAPSAPRCVVIVIDRSDSNAFHLQETVRVVRRILAELGPKDSVLLATMDRQTLFLKPNAVPVTPANRQDLLARVSRIEKGSGSDYKAMLSKVRTAKPSLVILVTDSVSVSHVAGDPADLVKLTQDAGHSQTVLHLVVLGAAPALSNDNIPRRLAAATGGASISVGL